MKKLALVLASLAVSSAALADWRDTRAEDGVPAGSSLSGSRETRSEDGHSTGRGPSTGSRDSRSEDGSRGKN